MDNSLRLPENPFCLSLLLPISFRFFVRARRSSTLCSNSFRSIGLFRYSSAPARNPRISISASSKDVKKIKGTNGMLEFSRIIQHNSIPSIWGIIISEMIKSGFSLLATSNATSPFSASRISYPAGALERLIFSNRNTLGLSSTINILPAI